MFKHYLWRYLILIPQHIQLVQLGPSILLFITEKKHVTTKPNKIVAIFVLVQFNEPIINAQLSSLVTFTPIVDSLKEKKSANIENLNTHPFKSGSTFTF